MFSWHKLARPIRSKVHLQKRFLNLHEYQSKGLMEKFGIQIQPFRIASDENSLKKVTEGFKPDEFVVKAQILAGGRGKGTFTNGFKGGVHLTKDPKEAINISQKMLGQHLVTKQTPPDGVKVGTVMLAEAYDLDEQKYLAIVLDREANGPVIIGSSEGGMDIEEVAETSPESIIKVPISYASGINREQAKELAEKMKFIPSLVDQAADEIIKIFKMFKQVDATQVEINPLGTTPDGKVVCFDAKLNFDDNAKFRQTAIFEMEDTSEVDPIERKATGLGLNYIKMDGNIACLVNGAGLAMATMDLIQLHGGSPANFLDVGGGVTEQQVTEAFEIIASDSQVKSILVNIFAGIVNCATIANGVIAACKKTSLKLPLVVRLEGTNVEEARKILAESGLPLITADGFDDAARKAVETTKR